MKAKERPKSLAGKTEKISTGCGSLYVTVNLNEGKPFEIFAKLGKAGGCSACQTEALTRSISIGLRSGVDIAEYHKTLTGIHCKSATFSAGEQVLSCPDAIARVIKMYMTNGECNDTKVVE